VQEHAGADVLYRRLKNDAHRKARALEVDQSPIGKTPRSCPATRRILERHHGNSTHIPEAKMRGYTASRFSFNTAAGRCSDMRRARIEANQDEASCRM